MASKLLMQAPSTTAGQNQLVFADHAGDFAVDTATGLLDATVGNRQNVEIKLVDLEFGVVDKEGRQSERVDLGVPWSVAYFFMGCLAFDAPVAAGQTVDFYWAPLPNTTITQGPGGVSGGSTEGIYSGHGATTVADSVKELVPIGSFITSLISETTGAQVSTIGVLEPVMRYGQLVVIDNTGNGTWSTNDSEMHIVANPIIYEGQ